MDRLIAEKETSEKKVETIENIPPVRVSIKVKEAPPISAHESYLRSFENMTVADIKKIEQEKEQKVFMEEKSKLIQQQYQEVEEETIQKMEMQEVSQNIIEKPNYDLLSSKKQTPNVKGKSKKKPNKKMVGILLACTLGACTVACVTNTIVIDNLNSNFLQLQDSYNFNLAAYLKKLYNLDTAKKGFEFIETYPDDLLPAGDLGEKSNWFDHICNFIGGLFGG